MPLIPKSPPGPPPGYVSDEEEVVLRGEILKAEHHVRHLEAKLESDDEEGAEGHEDKVRIEAYLGLDGDGEGDDGHEGKVSTGDDCDEGHEGKVSRTWHPYLQKFVDVDGDEGHEDKVSMYGDDEGDDGHEGKVNTGDECDAGHEGKVSRKWHPYLKQFVDVAGVDDDDDGDEDHEGQVSMDDAGDEDHEGKVSMDDCGDGDHSMVDDGGVAAAKQEMLDALVAEELEHAFMKGKERAAEGWHTGCGTRVWDTEVDEAWVEVARRGWDTDEDDHLEAVAEVVAMAAEEAGDDDGHDEEEATI